MKIQRALISVFDKTGLQELAKGLSKKGVEIISSGGTAAFLRKAKIKVTDVSKYTGAPEIMDGRVKPFIRRRRAWPCATAKAHERGEEE